MYGMRIKLSNWMVHFINTTQRASRTLLYFPDEPDTTALNIIIECECFHIPADSGEC
jgi:hypothetical protein